MAREDLEVRPFQPADLPQVLWLNEHAFNGNGIFEKLVFDNHDLEDPTVYNSSNRGVLLLGLIDTELVTMGGVIRETGSVGEIRRMRTRADATRCGYARYILGLLEDEARGFGYEALVLDTTTEPEQESARRLYETSGYYETHRKKTDNWVLKSVFYRKELQA